MPSTLRRTTPGLWSCVFTIAIVGLATGALWCLLALGLARGAQFLIVPLAAVIGFYFRWLGFRGKRGVACAIASVLIAFVYAQYLFAAVRVAQVLGFALRDTLFKMDWALAWQAASAHLGAWDFVWLAVACVATWMMLTFFYPRNG